MTPGFLTEVEAPQVYCNAETLIELWELKCRLADGQPFEAAADIYDAALDTVFAATFGLKAQDNTITSQCRQLLKHASSHERVDARSDPVDLAMDHSEQPVKFPRFPRPPVFQAIVTLTESLEVAVKAPYLA